MLVHPFEPVVDEGCTVLVLGSFPSVKSRENGFYYGHPRNRFWPMLAAVYGEEVPQDIPARKALLLRRHIALWDAALSCDIDGSMDQDIRNVVPTDLAPILSRADIRLVARQRSPGRETVPAVSAEKDGFTRGSSPVHQSGQRRLEPSKAVLRVEQLPAGSMLTVLYKKHT